MGKSSKIRNDIPPPHPRKLKILTTCAVLFGNITFGSALNFLSPSLEEMRSKYDVSVGEISIVFTIMLISFCSGAWSGGFIYNWMNRQLGIIICLAGISTTIILTPYCPTITIFLINAGILGFFIGAYDTNQVVWMIEMWQSKCGPYIQAQHFCYALGSTIPPLLVAPFLPNKNTRFNLNITNNDNEGVFSNETTSQFDLMLNNGTVNETADEIIDAKHESKIHIPFAIDGMLNLAAMSFQIFLFIFYRYYKPPLEEDLKEYSSSRDSDISEQASLTTSNYSVNRAYNSRQTQNQEGLKAAPRINWSWVRLVLISAMFLAAYCAMEICTLQFIPTFGQYSDLKLSEADSAFVLSGVTTAFATGRALGICIVLKVPPVPMLIINLVLVLVGNTILLFGGSTNLTMMWLGCVVLGAGFSTIYGCFCAFIERHLLFTNRVGSFMVVSASVFASVYSLGVGGFVENNVLVLIYANFLSIGLCVVALGTAYVMTFRNTEKVG